jgi:serine/threonine protein kinase/Tfp pilus assembly protein PilF
MSDMELDDLVSSRGDVRSSDNTGDARAIASQIKDRWDNGERADAWSVLTDHPELLATKSIVLDLAYEEYCQRCELGEAIDAAEFCRRFPPCRDSLQRLIDVHRYLEQNPQLLTDRSPRWPQPGDTFLGYRLIEELGRGAFARVFLASETALGQRRVAVKISAHGAAEAQTLGRLEHPNIVPVNSIQLDDATGLTAICMPYLGSTTLCDVLEFAFQDSNVPTRANVIAEVVNATVGFDKTPHRTAAASLLDGSYSEWAVHLIAQVADALAYAHDRGVCHLDLKPSNILLTSSGWPLLLDFNLSFDDRNAGQVCAGGTVPYMSPEQLPMIVPPPPDGLAPVDARSDIFSLGVILYELLSGSLPFGSVTLDGPWETIRDEMLDRHRAGPQPLPRDVTLDRELKQLVDRCVAFERKDRPQSADELAELLRRYVSPRRRVLRAARAHRRMVLAGACAVLGIALGTTYLVSTRAPYSVRELDRGVHAYHAADFDEAIEHLNQAVQSDPTLARALFMRGRSYQRLGQVNLALADYLAASHLAPDGPTLACIGYCNNRLELHGASIWNYEMAIRNGFAPAAVLNNLGYSYGQNRRHDDARSFLDQAIELDPQLQAAYYNRAMLEFRHVLRAKTTEPLPESAVADMEAAIRLGPITPELMRDAARVYAVAAREKPSFIDPALRFLQRAIEKGQDPGQFERDLAFSPLKGNPAFVSMLERTPLPPSATIELRIVDPMTNPPGF